MKRKITKILAALALLVFTMPSLVAWGQTTVSIDNFTAISGSIDANISYAAYKGNGTTAPAVSGGTLRIYKPSSGSSDGGYITITAALGCELNSVTITNSDDKAGTIKYSVDGGNLSDAISFAKSAAYTVENLTATSVSFYNCGGDRLSIAGFSVIYTGGGSQPTTYTVTYDCNGGTSGCPENVTGITAGTSINLADAPTKTNYTFNGWSDGTTTYNAGASYTVNSNVTMTAQWQLSISSLFYESFDDCNGTGGNDNQWSGTIASSTLISDNEGWTFANGNGAYKCAKFGAGSKLGSAQTPAISYTGNATLTFKAAAWNGSSESTTLKLSATSGTLSASTVTLVKGAWTDYTINITGIATSTQIKFEGNAASNSRFFLDEVMVVEAAPSTDPYITAEGIEIAYNATSGSIMAEIGNYVAGTITASTEAEWITNFTVEQAEEIVEVDFTTSENNSLYARTAIVNLTYTYGANQMATAEVTVIQNGNSNLPGGLDNPYTVAQAIEATPETGESDFVYVHGIVSEIVEAYSSQYHNISYNISDDGTTTSVQLEAFRGKGLNNANFTSDQDILPGDIVTIYGKLTYYNSTTYELAAGNYLVAFERPVTPTITVEPNPLEVNADEHTGSFTVTYTEIETSLSASLYWYTDANGNTTTDEPEWISAEINATSLNVDYIIEENTGAARTAYFKVFGVGTDESDVYSELVTINQAGFVAIDLRGVTTALVFNAGTFTASGSGYQSYENVTYTGNNQVDYPGWTLNNVMHSGENMQMRKNDGEVIIPTILTDYGFTITVNATTNSVFVGVGEDSEVNEYTTAETSADVVIKTGNSYAVISTITITPTQAPAGPSITVNGYGDTDGGYVLIASPTFEYADPVSIGMATGNYDLYYYDAEQDLEWRNYKAQDGGNYNLEPGKGYLYANQETVTITFTGTLNTSFTDVGLPYAENDVIKSLYLAGNSSTEAQTFYVFDDDYNMQTFNYLTMNEDGNGFITTQSTSYTAPAMTGFFVQAPGEGVFLSTYDINAKANVSLLNINVLRDRGSVIDNAIVSFSNGSMMDKFYLKNNTTRVYIPQGNREMAIANSAAEAEMPVSFRASENGTYTLAIETENVEMNYLHLIDNMTGMDIDLLQTPSYTFEAKTNDYTSRFRLVFKASSTSSEADETFAYYNGSSWTVSNLGEATLQVVDVTGRTVSSETINGNATISLNQTPGVYMLRLVNGNSVKVQKVVVR